jgi:hypothetical protein
MKARFVYENINFERGLDPKTALDKEIFARPLSYDEYIKKNFYYYEKIC